VLALILIGLTSSSTLPLHLSGGVVEAAAHTSLTTETLKSASRAAGNGRIAFVSNDGGAVSNREIYTMNPDGSDRRRLTFDSRLDSDPAWSPDGSKIAFAKFALPLNPNSSQIYVMNADGSDQRQLTQLTANRYHGHPTWSPDGTKIAFHNASYDGSNSSGVFVMNADGSGQKNIFQGVFLNPAWSPDGLKLAGNRGYDGLILINIDGSNLTHITQPPTPFDPATYFADFGPAWSPDGSKIVFSRFVNCDINDCYSARLYVINSDGSNLTDLTPQDNLGNGPAWSPDGRKIVFGGGDLYVINPDGSGLTNLTNTNDRFEYSPSWQPLSLPPAVNPIDDPQFFVRQQYLDFLSREPEAGGFNAWVSVLNGCANIFTGPEVSSGCDRIFVSQSFFQSPEFQLKGFYAFRFYRVAFNRLPEYSEIVSDISFVAGATAEEVYARKAQLAVAFTQRQEFQTAYGGLSNSSYVAALLGHYGLTQISTPDPQQPDGAAKVTLTAAELTNRLDAAALTRAQVFRAVADSDEVNAREFDNAFVAMQYYGYLRRKPEQAGFEAWLRVLQAGDTRTMVHGFVNSIEYRLRFGTP